MSKNLLVAPSIAAIILTTSLSAYFAYQYTADVKSDRFYTSNLASLQSASLNTITLSMRAASDASYIPQLELAADETNKALNVLRLADSSGIAALNSTGVTALDRFEGAWVRIEESVQNIVSSRSSNSAFDRQASEAVKVANSLIKEATDAVNGFDGNPSIDPRLKDALDKALSELVEGTESLATLPNTTSENLRLAQEASRAYIASLSAIGGAMPRDKALVDPLLASYKTAQQMTRTAGRTLELSSGAVDNAPHSRAIWSERDSLESAINTLRSAVMSQQDARLVSPMIMLGSLLLSGLVVLFCVELILRQARVNMKRATHLANNIQTSQKGRSEELHILIDEMKTLSNGDLSVEFSDTYDSTHEIAKTLNEVFPMFRSIVREVQQTIASLSAASEQTLAMARNTERSRNEQVKAITHIAKLIDELNSFTHQLDRVIRSAQENSRDVSSQIKSGSKAVSEVHEGVIKLSQSNMNILHQAKAMAENIQSLERLVEVVRRVANQAATISFNAHIVAEGIADDESSTRIRRSAEAMSELTQSAFSTADNITTNLNAINVAAKDTQYVLDESQRDIKALSGMSANAIKAMGEINETTSALVEGIVSVAGQTADLQKRSGQVAETMEQIHMYASDHSSASEQTATAISNLNTQAQRVGETLSQFKL